MLDPTEVDSSDRSVDSGMVDSAVDSVVDSGVDSAVDGGVDPGTVDRPSVWGIVWHRLTSPTKRTPADYAGRRLPVIINEVLDGRGNLGAAHEAQVGEAVGLVVDHALGAGRAGATTPLGHLGGAVGEYAWRVWDTPRGGEAA